MYHEKTVAVVIPAYNEQMLILDTLKAIPPIVDGIYIVDDCSEDQTPVLIAETAQKDPRVVHIRLEENKGVGAAIVAGYEQAANDGLDLMVVAAGDNQMDFNDLPSLLDPLVEGRADFSKGNRFIYAGGKGPGSAYQEMPRIRLFGSFVLSLLTKIASGYYWTFDSQCGYTAITQEVVKLVDWEKAQKRYGYPNDFLIRFSTYGIRVAEVPVRAVYLKNKRQSQLKIRRFYLVASRILVKGYLWRVRKEYFSKQPSLATLSFGSSVLLLILAVITGLSGTTGEFFGVNVTFMFLLVLAAQFWIYATIQDFFRHNRLRPTLFLEQSRGFQSAPKYLVQTH